MVVGPVVVEECRANVQRSVLLNCRKDCTHYFEPLPSKKALTHSAAGCLEFKLCSRTMALVLGEQESEGSRQRLSSHLVDSSWRWRHCNLYKRCHRTRVWAYMYQD